MMGRVIAWRGHRYLALAARLYLAVVFLMAGAYKVADPSSFAVDVATYGILPLFAINLFALVVPWVEVLTAALLVAGFRVRGASLLVSGMMVMFMVALSVALARGLDMSCGCFASAASGESDPIGWSTMLRDAGWLALGIYVLAVDRTPIGIDGLVASRRRV